MPMSDEPGAEGFFLQFDIEAPNEPRVIIDEDEKTCYAYLLIGGEIVGAVWLYNRYEAPEVPEWELPNAKEHIPFANARAYINHEGPAVDEGSRVIVLWGPAGAAVYLNGKDLHAIVGVGDFPGRCRYAAKDAFIARAFEPRLGDY
jgi:hypothetical protein